MPHLTTKYHPDIETPSKFEGVDFHFIAKSKKETLICVTVEKKTFFLTKQLKNGNNILKIEPTTRVTPISLGKKALNIYAKANNLDIIFSNTKEHLGKIEPTQEFLKDIKYFLTDEWKAFKKNFQNISIEVGFGSGRHLLHQATQHQNTLFIGLEIHTPSIEQVLKQIQLQNIQNILTLNYDARLFLKFMESNSISQIFVHFPVPWDKKPHRRVISHEFINESLRALKVDGSLELRTDSPNYQEYSEKLFKSYTNNKIEIKVNESLEVSSKYEDRWKRMQKDILDFHIYANTNNKPIDINKNFEFLVDDLNFLKLEEKLPTKPIVKNDYIVNFINFFTINNHDGLICVTLGSFNKPLSIFLKIENKKVSYFLDIPTPTSANYKAHKLLEELLQGCI